MTKHSWTKLDSFPIIFVIVFAIGIFVPCNIALSNGHVTPYVPYISEGGGEFPEAGIFSMCICISSFTCQWIIILRYLIVEERNSLIGNDMNTFTNKISFAIGSFACIAMIGVASYPASTISHAHNSAAGATCVCFVIYLVCHTVISFRILGRTKMSIFRLVITVFSIICLILVTTFGLIGSSEWTADYWPGKKVPGDKGFVYYVVSAACEWIFVFFFAIYVSSYIPEFKKSVLHFKMESPAGNQDKSRLSNIDIRPPRQI